MDIRALGANKHQDKIRANGYFGENGVGLFWGQMGMLGTGTNGDLGKWTLWGNTSRLFGTDGYWGK